MGTRLGTFVVRRRRAVMTAWLVIILATGFVASSAFTALSSDFGAGETTESGQIAAQLDELSGTGGEIAVLLDGVEVDGSATPARVSEGLTRLAAVDGVVNVADPWSTGADALVATDGQAALVIVTLTGGLDDDAEKEVADEVSDLAREIDAPKILVGGTVLVGEQFAEASEADLLRGEAIALPIAIIVMAILLGGLVAAGMPLLVALGGVVTTLAVLVGVAQVTDVSIFSINVVNMLGIGLGIDYGLLMINRFREERGSGLDVHTAVVRTVATAGTTVIFSALTVAVAMSGLFVFGVPILTSFGIAGLGVVLLSMAAAVTLLPAVLAAVGRRITPAVAVDDDHGRFFRLARWVQGRPVTIAVVVAGVLILMATPFLSARFENGDARTLPRSSEVRATALEVSERFPARGTDPVVVVVDVSPTDPALLAWEANTEARPDVEGVSIRPSTPDGITVVDVVPAGTSQGDVALDLVTDLRAEPTSFTKAVGGVAAELVDVKDILSSRLPWAVMVVVLATLVLLFLMTGSIVVPIKAVIMNILSLGASFGALVWIFQDGNLSGLLQFDSVGAIDLWMPVLILIFAFGLSMDYEVFLLSRIKEVHDETGDNDLSVALGLQRSGRIITSAAGLIVVVFAGFAAGEVLAIKQLGVGLAIAVIVDATLVRMLLVPATMKLLGERNWWAPAPLRRIHERFGLHEAPSTTGAGTAAGAVVDLTGERTLEPMH